MTDRVLKQRTDTARAVMRSSYGTEDGEFGVTLFVSHHLIEIPDSYWEARFQTSAPEPLQVIDSLVLLAHYGGDYDCDTLDFTLPGEVTNYLICVNFDANGEVEDISMES